MMEHLRLIRQRCALPLAAVAGFCFAADARAQSVETPVVTSRPDEGLVSLLKPTVPVSLFSTTLQGGKKPEPVFTWKNHPTLHLGPVELVFRARLQATTRHSDATVADEDESTADIARKRVGIEGSVAKVVDFQVERELGDDDPWRDVYLNYSQFTPVQVQVGKFKMPFSLDENTGATNLDFVYRSLMASTLAPGRDRGYMVHGRIGGRRLQYQLGRFEHDGRNAKSKNSDRVFGDDTVAARVVSAPFRTSKSVAREFEVGVAWASGDLSGEGLSGIRGKTVFGETFFSNDYPVLGRRKRLGFETRWQPGPVSLQAEFSRVTDERLGEGVEDDDLSPLRGRGWYVSGTWAITGDKKADGLDATTRPLFRGGIGAIEIVGRFEKLTFDSTAAANGSDPSTSPRADIILGNSDRVLTLGANWYLNRWVKVQFNLIKETLSDPEQGPLPTKPSFWSRVLKVQFTL